MHMRKSGDPDENIADGRRLYTRDILHVTSIRYTVLPEWWDVEEWACRVR